LVYSSRRKALGFDEIAYGVGGIELYRLDDLESSQAGYSTDRTGRSLVGDGPGDWSSAWVVIGHETACGDPIFLSIEPPHPVFMATHGKGEWTPDLIAPSLEIFWNCLETFRRFAANRGSPGEGEANPPNDEQIGAYLEELLFLSGRDARTAVSWAALAEIGMEDERWGLRLIDLLRSGNLR
jgi:hypothetical protein